MRQPDKSTPILPREWVHRFYKIELFNKCTKDKININCNSSNTFITDINPIWFVHSLIKTSARSLYILYLDTTNNCNDNCKMCFSKKMRNIQGLYQQIDVDLILRRISELKKDYPTFQVVSMAGPGEPFLLPRLRDILEQCNNLNIATRIFTNGKLLYLKQNRELLLKYTVLVRISIDAASNHVFSLTHDREGFAQRIENIEKLIEEKKLLKSNTIIGAHFVIQKYNYKEIVDFATLFKNLGVDYIVYSQETLGRVYSRFTDDEIEQIHFLLDEAMKLHDKSFSVITPTHVSRKTFENYNENYFSNPTKLNLCYSGSSRIFFSVTNKFSACWLDNSNDKFIDHSYIGDLQDNSTMKCINKMIQYGIGSVLSEGAYLGCDRCFSGNYNHMIAKILEFVDGYSSKDIDVKLIEY